MSSRKHDSIVLKVISELKRFGKPRTTLEVARALGIQKRKELNHTLYTMQDQGMVRKVQESPPAWQLIQSGVMQGVGASGGHSRDRGMGRGRGRGRGAPPTQSPPGYKFPANPQYNFPASSTSSVNIGFGRGRGRSSVPTTSTGTQNVTQHQSAPPLRARIREVLCRAVKPLTALEVAKQLDFSSRSSVNPDLYQMEKERVVCRHQPNPNSPPLWFLPGKGPGQSNQSSSSRVSSSSPVARGGQSVEKDSASCRGFGRGAGGKSPRKPQLVGYQSQPSEEEAMETDATAAASGPDLSHIPEENIEDRLLAVLQLNGPSSKKTELDLSSSISSTNRKYVRKEIQPHLQSLQGKGVVQRIDGMPVTWKLSSNLPQTPPTSLVGPTGLPNPFSSVAIAKGGSSPQKIGTGMGSPVIESTSLSTASVVNDMNRNPVSALSEFCQANKLELTFADVREFGPPHKKHFVIAARFGDSSYEAESTNKKEAKRMAADLALQSLNARQIYVRPSQSVVPSLQQQFPPSSPRQPATFFDKMAQISHDFYNKVQASVEMAQPGRKVIAAFILEDMSSNNFEVVSIGSGTRCITGDHMSLEGLVVNDSHAEVIARRSLMRFFYKQLLEFHTEQKGADSKTIFVPSKSHGNLVQVKQCLKFHLYISTAPCGDGAQFSRGDETNRDPPEDDRHHPTMLTKQQGVLRTKMEGGEGTIPIGDSQQQTWDGIMQGGRLRTMSCSDKVGRWNVVGLQGALLSHFMEPVYMSSLTLGSLHHHGHLARAVCCRFAELDGDRRLPECFNVNHPTLGRVQGGDEMRRHTEKTSNFSLNWAYGDERGELNDGVTGRPLAPPTMPRSQLGTLSSRVSKANLFVSFLQLAELTKRDELVSTKSYKAAKEISRDFQAAKKIVYEVCEKKGYGVWMKKPVEQELFDKSVLNRLNSLSS